MKIGYVTTKFPVLTETFIYREIEGLRKKGLDVMTFSVKRPRGKEIPREAEGLLKETFYLWPPNPIKFLQAIFYLLITRPGRCLDLFVSTMKYYPRMLRGMIHLLEGCYLAGVCQKRGIQHLHAHFATGPTSLALMTRELLGIPFSFTAHAMDIYRDRLFLEKKIKRAKFVVTVSEYNKRKLLSCCPGINPNKIKVIHCGIDTNRFKPSFRDERCPLEILSVGRLVEKKGFPYLIEACHRLKIRGINFRCWILGDGPQREYLEDLIAERGLQDCVSLEGAVQQEDLVGYYRRADIFVLPCVIDSQGDRDGIPVTLMEAMAMGLPVVSTPVSGIPELIQNRHSGLLVEPENAEQLAEAIKTLIQNRDMRKKFGERGRKKVMRDFNIEKTLELLISNFRSSEGVPPPKDKGSAAEPPHNGTKGYSQVKSIKYVIISPVRDEGKYIRRTIISVLSQTIPPQEWIIVDDGSTDDTPEIVAHYARKHPWIRLIHRENRGYRKLGQGVVEAFLEGYDKLRCWDYDFLVKLDGDLSFGPLYFENLFQKFLHNPRLGMASGNTYLLEGKRLIPERISRHHVRGAMKTYRRECFEAIGGLERRLAWDNIDEIRAQMAGWETRNFPELKVIHYQRMSSKDGLLRNRFRAGKGEYYMGSHPLFLILRGIYRMLEKPYLLSGGALILGYLHAWITGERRINDPEFVRFLRRKQLRRILKFWADH